jgi:hypothetical protein|tara:strand:- start:40 stop:279 length:240 start_codon:yes stop_codon:yes gene_type:complete
METAEILVYIILGLTLLGMIWFITNKGKQNLESAREASAPKVAGEDEISGSAQNPEQFDEPDEEALQEMADLLGEDDDD